MSRYTYEEIPLTFEKGLNDSVEDSMLGPGTAAVLQNWQCDPSGGLRCRLGWNTTSESGGPSDPRIGRGIGHFIYSTQLYSSPTFTGYGGYGGASSGTSCTITMDRTTVAGNALIAFIILQTNATGFTAPVGFTLAKESADTKLRIYVAENHAAAASFNFSWTTSQWCTIYIAECTNIATTSATDTTATATGTSTTVSSGTASTTSTPYDFAATILCTAHGTTPPDPNSMTNGFAPMVSGGTYGTEETSRGFIYGRKTLTAVGTAATAATCASQDWVGIMATFKAASTSDPSTRQLRYVAANAVADTGYQVYATDNDDLGATGWSLIDTIASTAVQSDPVAFTTGLSKLLYTSINFATARAWDSGGAASIATGPAGRCIAFHKSRVFIGGTIASPTLLHWSDVGATTFNTGTAGTMYVGRDDGEPIEDITPSELGLLIGKENSLWMLTGSGMDNFQLTQLNSGGVAPGRSLCRTPYGVVAAGRENVYLVAGGVADIISESVETSYGMTGYFMSTAYRNNRVYILDEGSGTIWVYDLKRGIWQGTQTIDTAAEQPSILYGHSQYLLSAPKAATAGGLLSYKEIPKGDRVKDFGTLPETFTVWTPEMWLGGPETKFTPRHLFLKLRQRVEGEGQSELTVTPVYDGVAGEDLFIEPNSVAGAFWVRLDIGQKAGISSLQLRFSHTVLGTETAIFDIERGIVGYDVEERR